jgi:hypothetical protein
VVEEVLHRGAGGEFEGGGGIGEVVAEKPEGEEGDAHCFYYR